MKHNGKQNSIEWVREVHPEDIILEMDTKWYIGLYPLQQIIKNCIKFYKVKYNVARVSRLFATGKAVIIRHFGDQTPSYKYGAMIWWLFKKH